MDISQHPLPSLRNYKVMSKSRPIIPITEGSCGQASPSSASTSYLRVRSAVFKIQNDSREFISSFGTHMLGIGKSFVTRRMAVAVPIPNAFAIWRQLAPWLRSWLTCSGLMATRGRPTGFLSVSSGVAMRFTTALVVANYKTLRIRIKRIGLQAFLGRGRISPVGSDPLRALNRRNPRRARREQYGNLGGAKTA